MIIPFFFKNKGLAIKPFIFVYNRSDYCLIEHEKVHLGQQRFWFPLNIPWLLMWFFNRKFRHKVEKEALIVQLKCMKEKNLILTDRESFIDFIVRTYYFKKEEAEQVIDKFLPINTDSH